MNGPFDVAFDDLPTTLPLFPLAGALLLPAGRLPLTMFEPRYLAMTFDALAAERMIGMVQPVRDGAAAVYPVGCAGRVSGFSETADGRLLVTLTGLCRFRVAAELDLHPHGYRRVRPDFAPFRADMVGPVDADCDRHRLLDLASTFLRRRGLSLDDRALDGVSDSDVVVALAMACPFESSEKQALLEAPDAAARAHTLVALLEMAVLSDPGAVPALRQ